MDLFAEGKPISLQEMLDVREKRALFQQEKLHLYQLPLLSFQCNIPGPIKTSPMIEQVFQKGIVQLKRGLAEGELLSEWEWSLATGPEYFAVVDVSAERLKEICIQIEEQGIGRLFDMDVLTLNEEGKPQSIARMDLGYETRACFICGQPAKVCGRSRKHELPELYQALNLLVLNEFSE